MLEGFWLKFELICLFLPQQLQQATATAWSWAYHRNGRLAPSLLLFGKKRAAAEQELHAMERARIFSPSSGGPWAAPLHMVKKLGLEQWHPCGDYSNLNLRTITNSYVIPNLHSLNFQYKGKQIFFRFNLVKGYYQMQVNKASQAKTVVVTPFGTFQFNFMPFGLKNAGATFNS